jgi:hypothetical protein
VVAAANGGGQTEATFRSLKDCQTVEDQLLTRLTKNVPPAVKLKCLRVAKHCVLKGEISFKRDLQRRLGPIRACLGIGPRAFLCALSLTHAFHPLRGGACLLVLRHRVVSPDIATIRMLTRFSLRVPRATGSHPWRCGLSPDQRGGAGNVASWIPSTTSSSSSHHE